MAQLLDLPSLALARLFKRWDLETVYSLLRVCHRTRDFVALFTQEIYTHMAHTTVIDGWNRFVKYAPEVRHLENLWLKMSRCHHPQYLQIPAKLVEWSLIYRKGEGSTPRFTLVEEWLPHKFPTLDRVVIKVRRRHDSRIVIILEYMGTREGQRAYHLLLHGSYVDSYLIPILSSHYNITRVYDYTVKHHKLPSIRAISMGLLRPLLPSLNNQGCRDKVAIFYRIFGRHLTKSHIMVGLAATIIQYLFQHHLNNSSTLLMQLLINAVADPKERSAILNLRSGDIRCYVPSCFDSSSTSQGSTDESWTWRIPPYGYGKLCKRLEAIDTQLIAHTIPGIYSGAFSCDQLEENLTLIHRIIIRQLDSLADPQV